MQEFNTFLDPFDLICHLAHDQPPLTRRDRALNVGDPEQFERAVHELQSALYERAA